MSNCHAAAPLKFKDSIPLVEVAPRFVSASVRVGPPELPGTTVKRRRSYTYVVTMLGWHRLQPCGRQGGTRTHAEKQR